MLENFLFNDECRFITPYNKTKHKLEHRLLNLAKSYSFLTRCYECEFEYGSPNGPLHFTQEFWIDELVMFTVNLDVQKDVVNGGLAKIIDLKASTIVVKCLKTNLQVDVTFNDYQSDYAYKKAILKGRICCMPLQQAYFCTLHRCLGLTLKKIIVDIRNQHFVHGMLYVALSRVKHLSDISFYGLLSFLTYTAHKINRVAPLRSTCFIEAISSWV